MELILKIVTGTNGRYYVTERGVVIHTTHDWYDAWDFLGEYESYLQEVEVMKRYPGLI